MKELSTFIDESGDFGEYDHHSPYYIITMVFHNQQKDIQPAVSKLNQELSYLNLDNLCIHTGPIIRKVMPSDYKLFQAADLLYTLKLVRIKLENNMFSKSEKTFFGNIRDLKKNYIKPLSKMEWPCIGAFLFLFSLIILVL